VGNPRIPGVRGGVGVCLAGTDRNASTSPEKLISVGASGPGVHQRDAPPVAGPPAAEASP
jgi:hypothetical protein